MTDDRRTPSPKPPPSRPVAPPRGGPKDRYRRAIEEARAGWSPERQRPIDWQRVETELFRRVAQPPPADVRPWMLPGGQNRAWGWAGAALTLAAVAMFAVGRPASQASLVEAESHAIASAGVVVPQRSDSEVRIGSSLVANGQSIHEGDVIDVRRGEVTFDRPGRVRWMLERGTRVDVRKAQATLLVALERGALEAQVEKVSEGEAFAVEIDGVRVAVHGTHLRVARVGPQVTVDLSEGVVSIGYAPRRGMVEGRVFSAPAHIEFDATQHEASMSVDHAPASVRSAVSLDTPPPQDVGIRALASGSAALASPAVPRVSAEATEARSGVVTAPRRSHSESQAPATIDRGRAEQKIIDGVVACTGAAPRADGVTVIVTSSLELRVGADGIVNYARFEPPLAPEIQNCAADVIFKTRFIRAGNFKLPIDVHP